MKIGIITQPLINNYGGILQNYALQQVLKREGHDVITLDQKGGYLKKHAQIVYNIKVFIKNYLCGKRCLFYSQKQKVQLDLDQEFTRFCNANICKTYKMLKSSEFRKFCKGRNFDAFIVGSDQVWRPIYAPLIGISYLDFTKDFNVRRIAYAASFGVDFWEYTSRQTKLCKSLINRFDAVSVREDSGVTLCHQYLNVDASHVLDPTMLLSQHDYVSLFQGTSVENNPYLLEYILNKNSSKKNIINTIANEHKLKVDVISTTDYISGEKIDDIEKVKAISIEEWLKKIACATIVVTDSFHGTVFSIIFNKNFYVLENTLRGNDRLVSLLKMFSLEDRVIKSSDSAFDNQDIDWDKTNELLTGYRKASLIFLNRSLDNV